MLVIPKQKEKQNMATTTETGVIKPRRGFDTGVVSGGLKKLGDVQIPKKFFDRISCGIEVMDSLINGDGIIRGQRITCAAPRGSGKTTFWLQYLQAIVTHNSGIRCAYLSNEEHITQLAYTAQRLGTTDVVADNMTDLDSIAAMMEHFDIIVIDSVAGLQHPDVNSDHIMEKMACDVLNKAAQKHDCAIIYIQHMTKAGDEKGGSHWGHAVDTCIRFDKLDVEEYGENCRMISVEKNRFGSQAEVILKLTREGFDFNAPIENRTQGNDCNKGQNVYLTNKLRDNKALMIRIKEKNSAGGAKIQDFGDLGIDMGRVERLLKDLGSRGRIVKIGGGQGNSKDSIRYLLGDTTPEDFGESSD